eukprot:SAG31_NODE_1486_length_8148_cov_6.234439_4_plen_131_part_00
MLFCGRGEKVGAQIAAELGDNCAFMRADVTVEHEIAAVIERAVALWGRLDVLFNNAGGGGGKILRWGSQLWRQVVSATAARCPLMGPYWILWHARSLDSASVRGILHAACSQGLNQLRMFLPSTSTTPSD